MNEIGRTHIGEIRGLLKIVGDNGHVRLFEPDKISYFSVTTKAIRVDLAEISVTMNFASLDPLATSELIGICYRRALDNSSLPLRTAPVKTSALNLDRIVTNIACAESSDSAASISRVREGLDDRPRLERARRFVTENLIARIDEDAADVHFAVMEADTRQIYHVRPDKNFDRLCDCETFRRHIAFDYDYRCVHALAVDLFLVDLFLNKSRENGE